MADWSYSGSTYNKARLLGQIKAQYAYLNLCSDHTFLSPTYNLNGRKKVLTDKHPSKMRELRESLRQAALINIVAAVNEGDKLDKRRQLTNSTASKSNQYGLQHLHRENTDTFQKGSEQGILFQQPMAPLSQICMDRTTAIPPFGSTRTTKYRDKGQTPRKQLDDFSEAFTIGELDVLEGKGITAPKQISETSRTTKQTRPIPKISESGKDIALPKVNKLNHAKNVETELLIRPSLKITSNAVNENTITEETKVTIEISLSGTTSDSDGNNKQQDKISEVSESVGNARLNSVSTEESVLSSNRETRECKSVRDSLQISTKAGQVGRSVGYFPTPSSGNKRDSSRKLPDETRIAKCDAIDILDHRLSSRNSELPMIIKSQRDHLGEMGTSLFGLKRTTSLPAVSSKIRKQRKCQKLDKEMNFTSESPGSLRNGIVGVNIGGDRNQDQVQGQLPFSGETNADRSTTPPLQYSANIYHLDKESPKPISLEGQSFPTLQTHHLVDSSEEKSSLTLSKLSYVPKNKHLYSRTHQYDHGDTSLISPIEPQVSRQIYDFRGLCIDSDPCVYTNFQTTKQITPSSRKSDGPSNALSAVFSSPRTRPINASMSASKLLEENKKPQGAVKDVDGDVVGLSINTSKIIDQSAADIWKVEDQVKKSEMCDSFDTGDQSSESSARNREPTFLSSITDSYGDFSRQNTPKTPGSRNPSGFAKNQGISSMNPRIDKMTKLHIISDSGAGETAATVKILKSLDQDIYADFTHRKHRKLNQSNNICEPDSKVVKVKVNYGKNDFFPSIDNSGNPKPNEGSDDELELDEAACVDSAIGSPILE